MTQYIDFYFDFGSPTSYLAFTQLETIAKETNNTLVYKPVLLGGIFQATGNASPITIPAKGAYTMRDLMRYAALYQVPLKFNPYFPINTMSLMRIAIGLQMYHPESFLKFITSVFEAMWVEGLNMGDVQVLEERIKRMGLDVQTTLDLQNDVEVKSKLKSETEAAVKRGLFGVPTMFVGDEMFWGQDRLDFVKRELLKKSS